MKYKTKIWVSFNYGGWHLSFSKEFDLPFVPFYNLTLFEEVDGIENSIKLNNNDYCNTIIEYDNSKSIFIINVRTRWEFPVSDDNIDYTLISFETTGWERRDNTNIEDFKKIMRKDELKREEKWKKEQEKIGKIFNLE